MSPLIISPTGGVLVLWMLTVGLVIFHTLIERHGRNQ